MKLNFFNFNPRLPKDEIAEENNFSNSGSNPETDVADETAVNNEEELKGTPDADPFSTISDLREFAASNPEHPLAKSIHASLNAIEGFRQGTSMTLEDTENSLNTLLKITGDIASGNISPEMLQLIMKGENYERDLKKAYSEGELAGRNAGIEEELSSDSSDGVPALGGSAGSVSSSSPSSIFDLAGFAK